MAEEFFGRCRRTVLRFDNLDDSVAMAEEFFGRCRYYATDGAWTPPPTVAMAENLFGRCRDILLSVELGLLVVATPESSIGRCRAKLGQGLRQLLSFLQRLKNQSVVAGENLTIAMAIAPKNALQQMKDCLVAAGMMELPRKSKRQTVATAEGSSGRCRDWIFI